MNLFASNSRLSLFLLLLVGPGCGQDALPPGPVDVLVGKNVTLTTLLDDPNATVIIWSYSNGKEQINIGTVTGPSVNLNKIYEGRVTINRTNGYLSLGPVKPEDSGDYSINAVIKGVTRTGEIKVRVLEPVSDVAIKSDLPEAIEQESTVVLTCSAKGSFLKFTWLNGTAPIVADGDRITLNEMESSSALTIRDVRRTDLVGPIYCSAANKVETEKSPPFNLTVYYGPDAVLINPPITPEVLRAGSDYNLTCSASSFPPAKFTWYHNSNMLEASGPLLTLALIEKNNVGMDRADYTCKAENTKTKRTVPSPPVAFALMDGISGVTVTGPTDVLIAGNSTANISCRATAGKSTTTTWLKDAKPLSASARVVFAEDRSSVVIKPLQKEDNGEYVCQLSNAVTTERASYKMVVNYGPEPAVVTGQQAVEFNDKVQLVCSAASVPPANFTWKFNGTLTDVKTATYAIEQAAYKNSGTYSCEAHNSVTGKTSTSTHTLAVKEEGTLDNELSDGAIAGIVIGVLVALGAAIGLIMYCRQKVPVESPY